MHDRETANYTRGLLNRSTMKNVKDDGEVQTASVEIAKGVWRDDVEVLQPYGFAAHVPEDGALCLVFAIGGDEGDLVAVPVANPSKRMGKLAKGEVGLYNEHGDKLLIGPDGVVDLNTGAEVKVKAPKATVTAAEQVVVTSPKTIVNGPARVNGPVTFAGGGGQAMEGDLTVRGNIRATGDITPATALPPLPSE